MKTKKVYVSGTVKDLVEYLDKARDQIRKMGLNVVSMDTYVAEDKRPLDRCLEDVRNCDLYVGIFAWRYGFIPLGQDKSITELEYREAGEHGIERLIFLLDPDVLWHRNFMDSTSGDETKISNLREELSTDRLVSFFKSPEDLARLLAAAIHRSEERSRNVFSEIPEAPQHHLSTDGLSGYLSLLAYSNHALELEKTFVGLRYTLDDANQSDMFLTIPHNLPRSFRVIDHAFPRTIDVDSNIQTIDDLLEKHSRLLILGEPGGGKTTSLKYLTIMAARKALCDSRAPVPLFIDLAQWPSSITDFRSLIVHERQVEGINTIPIGRLLLLLDGLNEIPSDEYKEKIGAIESWLCKNPSDPIIIASREEHYKNTTPLSILTVKIHQLDETTIEQFIRKYLCFDKVDDLLIGLSRNSQQGDLKYKISHFTRNPFQLRIVCFLYEKQSKMLFLSKIELFRSFVLILYQRELDLNNHFGISYEEIIEAFGSLAVAMIHKKTSTSVHVGWAVKQLTKDMERKPIITLGCQAGLIRLTKNDQFLQFAHQLLLEYFALENVVRNLDQCVNFIVDPVFLEGCRVSQPFDEVLHALIDLLPPESILSLITTRDPFLAADIVKSSGISGQIHNELLETIISRLIDAFTSSIRDRQLAAVEALANIGEPVLPFISPLLKKGEFWVRRLAVKTLGTIYCTDALELLIDSLTDEHSWVRRDASDIITAWAEKSQDLLIRYISERLQTKDHKNREDLALCLWKCFYRINNEICSILEPLVPKEQEGAKDNVGKILDDFEYFEYLEKIHSPSPFVPLQEGAEEAVTKIGSDCKDHKPIRDRLTRVKPRPSIFDRIAATEQGHVELRKLLSQNTLLPEDRKRLVNASLKWMLNNIKHPYFHTLLRLVLETCEMSATQINKAAMLFNRRFKEVAPGVSRGRRFKIIRYFAQYHHLMSRKIKKALVYASLEWLNIPAQDYITSADVLESLQVLSDSSRIPADLEKRLKELTLRAKRFSKFNGLIMEMIEKPNSVNMYLLRELLDETRRVINEIGWGRETRHYLTVLIPLAVHLGEPAILEESFKLASTVSTLLCLSTEERGKLAYSFYRRVEKGLWPNAKQAVEILGSIGFDQPEHFLLLDNSLIYNKLPTC